LSFGVLACNIYSNAGLERNIRTGKSTDVAYLAPALIPVPGTFEGNTRSEILKSYVGQKVIEGVRQSLVRSDIGKSLLATLC
jgi:hypothetical protein